MSIAINQNQQQNQTQGLMEEISAVVGINFEPQTIQSTLAENDFDFLLTIAALIQKCKSENKIQTFKAKVPSAKSKPLSGEASKSEFTSIRSLDIFPEPIGFEPSNASEFMKTGIFEENKKSEEFKESSQKARKTAYAPNIKVLNFTEEFMKEVKANYKKNVNYYNTSQANKENPEKAKVGNKKKLLKIMAFRFIKQSKEEGLKKEEYDGRYENDELSPDAEHSLYSNLKKFEGNSNIKTNKKNNPNKNGKNGSKDENYKNKNNVQNSFNNNKNTNPNKNNKENTSELEDIKQIGIIDVEVEKFFNSNEKQLNELTRQQNSFNSSKKQKDLDAVNFINPKLMKKQNDSNQVGNYNNNNGRNNANNYNNGNAYQSTQIYYENYSSQNQNQNNSRFMNNNFKSNVRNQNVNGNMNQNLYNNNSNYNKAYAGNNFNNNNSYADNNNQQNYIEVNYIPSNNDNRNFYYNQNQSNQYDQGFSNFDNRGIQKGSYANNASYNNNNFNNEDRYGNKKNKMHKGKRY